MVIYYLKKAKAWFTLAILSASLLAPMQTKTPIRDNRVFNTI